MLTGVRIVQGPLVATINNLLGGLYREKIERIIALDSVPVVGDDHIIISELEEIETVDDSISFISKWKTASLSAKIQALEKADRLLNIELEGISTCKECFSLYEKAKLIRMESIKIQALVKGMKSAKTYGCCGDILI